MFDQLPQTAGSNPPRAQRHQLAVRDTRAVRLELHRHAPPNPMGPVCPHRYGCWLGIPCRPVPVGAVGTIRLTDRLQAERHRRLHHALFHGREAARSRPAWRLGNLDDPDGCALGRLLAQGLVQCRDPLLFVPCVHTALDRHAIHTRRPLVCLALSPGRPEDVHAPDLVLEALQPFLLVLLGCPGEGALQLPDCVCAVGSLAALGHPRRLRAPVTAGGRRPSRPVSQAIHAVL